MPTLNLIQFLLFLSAMQFLASLTPANGSSEKADAPIQFCEDQKYFELSDKRLIIAFEKDLAGMLQWDTRYRSYSNLQVKEKQAADVQRKKARNNAIDRIKDRDQILSFTSEQLSQMASAMDAKAANSVRGDVPESFYLAAGALFWDAFIGRRNFELQCQGMSGEEVLQIAIYPHQNQADSVSQALKKNTVFAISQLAARIANDRLLQEMELTNPSAQELEIMGIRWQRLLEQHKNILIIKALFKNLTLKTFAKALEQQKYLAAWLTKTELKARSIDLRNRELRAKIDSAEKEYYKNTLLVYAQQISKKQ
jgi:hypothetical protein